MLGVKPTREARVICALQEFRFGLTADQLIDKTRMPFKKVYSALARLMLGGRLRYDGLTGIFHLRISSKPKRPKKPKICRERYDSKGYAKLRNKRTIRRY